MFQRLGPKINFDSKKIVHFSTFPLFSYYLADLTTALVLYSS